MAQIFLYNTGLLIYSMILLINFYSHVKAHQQNPYDVLQCTKKYSWRLIKIECCCPNVIITQSGDLYSLEINCNNKTLPRFSLPLKISDKFETEIIFNSCRFSTNENILNFLRNTLHLKNIYTIVFKNNFTDSFVRQANLIGFQSNVSKIAFDIETISILPIDLLDGIKNLYKLVLISKSMNSSHLSRLLTPIRYLKRLFLKTNNFQEISEDILDQQKGLLHVNLEFENIRALSSGFLSSISNSNTSNIRLSGYCNTPRKASENTNQFVLLPKLPKLAGVSIECCQLESISADMFNNSNKLLDVKITGNFLTDIPDNLFIDQKNLTALNFSRNQIRGLREGLFDNNGRLTSLDFSFNQLTTLPADIFKYLTYLEILILDNNKFLSTNPDSRQPQSGYVFYSLINLNTLSLRNNFIKEMPNDLFTYNNKDLILDLTGNNISSIDCNYVDAVKLNIKINLKNNPINCDCKMLCLHQQNSKRHNFKNIRCKFPTILQEFFLYELTLNEMLCFPDNAKGNASSMCYYSIPRYDSILTMNCSVNNFKDIPTLPMRHYAYSNGIELIMDDNPLNELSSEALKNSNVAAISISNSNITELPSGFLSNLSNLINVTLILPLQNISENTFDYSIAITSLQISGTNIESLPQNIFRFQTKLMDLNLSGNRLKEWPKVSFYSSKTLRLSHNCIKQLKWSIFLNLSANNFKSIFLDNNSIEFIDEKFFKIFLLLENLDLTNNKLKTLEAFPSLRNLQKLILKNNTINNHMFESIPNLNFTYLDMSSNQIDSIDLLNLSRLNCQECSINFNGNNIHLVKVADRQKNRTLGWNCKLVSFEKNTKQSNMYEAFHCLSPNISKYQPASYLSPEEILFTINDICPENCTCRIRAFNSTLLVNCVNASLTQLPTLPEFQELFKNGIELFVEHNRITSLTPKLPQRFANVRKLVASHNQITNITSMDIPEKLFHLDVSYNRIERLNEVVIQESNLETVLLHDNPILCDCASEKLILFILRNKTLFPDIEECGDGQKFESLSFADICFNDEENELTMVLIVLTIISLTLFVLAVLYFKNKEEFLVWMYANNICLWWVTEEEVDADKRFDAFISYSSRDQQFIRNLVSELEKSPTPYKLCLHDRDWLAGGYIPDQIEASVECSKRTLIVMTQNYLNSKWTRLEFRTAHNASLNEKRPRVIVILVGEIDIEQLDPDLRKYIKMYTYLKWEDPWFWDRLRYALPHPSKRRHQKTQQHNARNVVPNDDVNFVMAESSL